MAARRAPARRLQAAAATLAGLALLTACEKPAPLVTVVNAGRSVYAEANVYCFEGQSNADGNCANRRDDVPTLAVSGGQPVGVDVAKPVVERTWRIELTDTAAPAQGQKRRLDVSTIQDGHYLSFTAPAIEPGGALLLTVRALGAEGQSTGEWRFRLVPR